MSSYDHDHGGCDTHHHYHGNGGHCPPTGGWGHTHASPGWFWGGALNPWMQWLCMWQNAIGSFMPMPVAPPRWPAGGACHTPPPKGRSMASRAPKVEIAIHCTSHVEVEICLYPGADRAKSLRAHAVHEVHQSRVIRRIEFKAQVGCVAALVIVPPQTKPGLYCGPIRNESGTEMGHITIEVAGTSAKATGDGTDAAGEPQETY